MNEDYSTIPQVDVALYRATARQKAYRAAGDVTAVLVMDHVIDRLLARRFVLMPPGVTV